MQELIGQRPTPAGGDDSLLTVREAASLMRVGRDTAYALVAERKIPAVRLGRQIRIPRAALIALLEREATKSMIAPSLGAGVA